MVWYRRGGVRASSDPIILVKLGRQGKARQGKATQRFFKAYFQSGPERSVQGKAAVAQNTFLSCAIRLVHACPVSYPVCSACHVLGIAQRSDLLRSQ